MAERWHPILGQPQHKISNPRNPGSIFFRPPASLRRAVEVKEP